MEGITIFSAVLPPAVIVATLSLVVSVLAFGVSAYSVYKNFIYSSIQLLYTIGYTGAVPKGNYIYEPYIDLVVSNVGNTPGIVISLTISLVENKSDVATYHYTNWKKFVIDDKETMPSTFPVKGKDVAKMRVYFEEINLQSAFSSGETQINRYASLELGTLDKKNEQVWVEAYLDHLWFDSDDPNPAAHTDHRVVSRRMVKKRRLSISYAGPKVLKRASAPEVGG
jgi:hypothetical protein